MIDAAELVQTAVLEWAQQYYHTPDVEVYVFIDEDEDPERFVAVLAARGLDSWQAVEAWMEAGQVVSINDLGEGVPPDGVNWPWDDAPQVEEV